MVYASAFLLVTVASSHAFGAGSPLAHISIQQRVSVIKSDLPDSPPISLYYTRHEFMDAVSRICKEDSLQLSDGAII
jgi:hypothetical protein